ncbi:MAG: RNA polymerase-binding protein DksA [Rhodoferax sp.]|nr:RNA polymerase-binding protein DksA [Rhodoferax sp.]
MKAQAGKVKVVAKVVKAVAKAKPAVKAAAKPPAKPVAKAKPPVKKASPVKVPAKAAAGAKERKPAAKVVPAKGVKSAAVKAVKAKAKVKDKVKEKDSVRTMIAKAAKPQLVAPKPSAVPPVSAVKTVLPTPGPVTSSAVPARAGRPSSRLAQLTVPSMAQSVASTAAKASFTQSVVSPLIVPPLASSIKKDPKLANNWKAKAVEQLSDAEVIAMPDDEYMNETQMAFFRLRLIKLKRDILSNAGETTEHLREDTVVVPDPADRATIEEEHALELRTRDRERKLLKKIEQSIARIDAGDYGYCDETGEPIGVGRLLARPTANLSLEAQQRRELKQKMFGD